MNPTLISAALPTAEQTLIVFPIWSIVFFIGLLLTIGIMSFLTTNYPDHPVAHFWENNTYKLILALLWALPVVIIVFFLNAWSPLLHALEEYFAFIVMLLALFVIAGGIHIEGDLLATPRTNTSIFAIGSVLANVVGTTGASMLLIRLVLRTNAQRKNVSHIPIFFIFTVSNVGGCLLPIGDPPLFLGYLLGVPFFWTLNLFPQWLFALLLILGIFYVWDSYAYSQESEAARIQDIQDVQPIKIIGKINFLWLLGVLLAVVFITPQQLADWGFKGTVLQFLREYVMLAMVGLSLWFSPMHAETRQKNKFTWAPILEVAFLFIGIFIAMVPAQQILRLYGLEFGLSEPSHFFWATGVLSAVLDNAPTYVTFVSLAQGMVEANPMQYQDVAMIQMSNGQIPHDLLAAISLGSVFMGAMTYIGNAPNFMVKVIADEWNYKTPDFFTFVIKYSFPVLIPVFFIVTVVFL